MTYKMTQKGKYYSIPLEGFTFSKLDMTELLGLELIPKDTNEPTFVIDIYGEFNLTRFNQKQTMHAAEKETIKSMVDLIGLTIKKIQCSKSADLFITFNDDTEIHVPDAEYENWYINTIHQERIKNAWVIGGVGMTSWF